MTPWNAVTGDGRGISDRVVMVFSWVKKPAAGAAGG